MKHVRDYWLLLAESHLTRRLLARCYEGWGRSPHRPDRRAEDRNRFRRRAILEKEKCLRNGWGKRECLALRVRLSLRKALHSKTWLERLEQHTLHICERECILSVGRKVKSETPYEHQPMAWCMTSTLP
jgi:hypothetical protein